MIQNPTRVYIAEGFIARSVLERPDFNVKGEKNLAASLCQQYEEDRELFDDPQDVRVTVVVHIEELSTNEEEAKNKAWEEMHALLEADEGATLCVWWCASKANEQERSDVWCWLIDGSPVLFLVLNNGEGFEVYTSMHEGMTEAEEVLPVLRKEER